MVKESLEKSKVEVVIFQETKMGRMNRRILRDVTPFHMVDGVFLPSFGASGGIQIFWDAWKIEEKDSWMGTFSVSFRGKLKCKGIGFIGVNKPCNGSVLPTFLEELEGTQTRWVGTWCIGSDFNEVREPGDKIEENRNTRGMMMFSEFVDNNALREVPIAGFKFTWLNL